MAVNWKNVGERVLSTTTQALLGALAAGAEFVMANGLDWRTAAVAVGVPALLSLAKNLQAELTKDLTDLGATPAQVQAVQDAEKQVGDLIKGHLP